MRVGPRAESRRSQKILQALNLGMFVGIVILAGLDPRFGWSQVPAALVVVANLLMLAALGASVYPSRRARRDRRLAISWVLNKRIEHPALPRFLGLVAPGYA